jgi:hypothetical protein
MATFSANAANWSGTSTTYGNTTYHNFHSNQVQVLEAPPRYNNDGAMIAGGLVIGALVGALIYKCVESCRQPKPVYQCNYYYDTYTQQYVYYNY